MNNIEISHRPMQKRKKSLHDVRFDTFIGRFPSDTVVSMAVKGWNNYSNTGQLL